MWPNPFKVVVAQIWWSFPKQQELLWSLSMMSDFFLFLYILQRSKLQMLIGSRLYLRKFCTSWQELLNHSICQLVCAEGSFSGGQMRIAGSRFFLRPTAVGFTTIHVTAKRNAGNFISSQLIRIEVYAPLTIHPGAIFLVPGSSYDLTVKGGPSNDVYLKYLSMNDSVVTVDPLSGRLYAVDEGKTAIRAFSLGLEGKVIEVAHASVRAGKMLKTESSQARIHEEEVDKWIQETKDL